MQVTYKAVPYKKACSLLLSNVSTTGWNRPVLTEGCIGGGGYPIFYRKMSQIFNLCRQICTILLSQISEIK